MSAEELERAWRFRRPEDRPRFIVGRGTLRLLLGACLATNPGSLRFSQSEFGKPSLVLERGPCAPRFNVSGSEGLALVALASDLEIGVDLEYVRDDPEIVALARRLAPAKAAAVIESAPVEDRPRLFLEQWVRHEALAKASGLGLRQMQSTAGTVMPLVPPAPDYVAAVAATSPFERVRCLSLAT